MNISLLRLLNLPVFSDKEEFSFRINLPVKLIDQCISNPEHFYRRFLIRKRSGGQRLIAQPNSTIKAIQAWILRNILDKLHPSSHATAYRKGQGLINNTTPHASHRYFLCLDIADFFPSIESNSVKSVFLTIGYNDDAARILTALCCFRTGLPQGGVTSPALSNLVLADLDRRISRFAAEIGVAYTRYADDLVISGNNPLQVRNSQGWVTDSIEKEGFRLNHKKTRLLGPSKRCVITGLTKNSSLPEFSIGTRKKREMRAIMHRFATGKAILGQYNSKESIEGWLAFLSGNDKKSFISMKKYWERQKLKAERFGMGCEETVE